MYESGLAKTANTDLYCFPRGGVLSIVIRFIIITY